MFTLFRIKDRKLVFNREQVFLYKEFVELVKGRNYNHIKATSEEYAKKKVEEQYFKYLYHYCHYQSPHNGLDDKKRHIKAAAEAGFSVDFKQDTKVKNAIRKFLDLQASANVEVALLVNVKRSLSLYNIIVEEQIIFLTELLEKTKAVREKIFNNSDEINVESTEYVAFQTYIQTMREEMKDLLPMTGKIKDSIDLTNDLTEALLKTEQGDMEGRGGKKVGRRADPR